MLSIKNAKPIVIWKSCKETLFACRKWPHLHFEDHNVINQTFIKTMKWLSYKVVFLCFCINGVNSLLACLIELLPCWNTSFDLFIVAPCIFELKKMKVVKNDKI
jgi:branched-subunit amino acid transport protein AzlD